MSHDRKMEELTLFQQRLVTQPRLIFEPLKKTVMR